MKWKKNDKIALLITEKAKDTTIIDCDINGGVENYGERTRIIRTRIKIFRQEHSVIYWITIIASVVTIVGFIWQVREMLV